ncbi:regulatory subunit of cyclin-dependent kinase [Phycomyces blakesleeanus]
MSLGLAARWIPHSDLLTEREWRSLGIRQSRGWEHYMVHAPEPHILLFRREKNYAEKHQGQRKLRQRSRSQKKMYLIILPKDCRIIWPMKPKTKNHKKEKSSKQGQYIISIDPITLCIIAWYSCKKKERKTYSFNHIIKHCQPNHILKRRAPLISKSM